MLPEVRCVHRDEPQLLYMLPVLCTSVFSDRNIDRGGSGCVGSDGGGACRFFRAGA